MAEKKKPTSAGSVPLTVWIDRHIREQLDAYLESTDPQVSIKAAVEKGLRDFLSTVGFWPPPSRSR